jgi:DDE superfamily endonuclease
VAWDNSNTHEDDEIEEVLRGAAGRLVLLYLPTYSPWLRTRSRCSGATSVAR